MVNKTALITGITGQDGSYLSELLLDKGYDVHGIMRRSSMFTTARIEHLYPNNRFHLHHGDLTDSSNLHKLVQQIKPDEVYHLGAQSHVGVSFEVPEYTAEVDAIGTLRLLDAVLNVSKDIKFYQASTSELYGGFPESAPQNELTPFHPRSPYGVAKLYAYWIAKNYREAHHMFICNGILFNHESPRRGETFVTKKITKAVANIGKGKQDTLVLGNLDAYRDWGYAKDYVRAMWLMLQMDNPDDYVIATGRANTIRDFTEMAFGNVGMDVVWEGIGKDEIGRCKNSGKIIVKVSPEYYRPAEVSFLLGDASKARQVLNWEPTLSLEDLCSMMVRYDWNHDSYGGKDTI